MLSYVLHGTKRATKESGHQRGRSGLSPEEWRCSHVRPPGGEWCAPRGPRANPTTRSVNLTVEMLEALPHPTCGYSGSRGPHGHTSPAKQSGPGRVNSGPGRVNSGPGR
eukprot:499181-Prorocentrum_minimum.AAC.1